MRRLQLENAAVRVTRRDLEPGEGTGHHRHDHDYVVVPLTDGSLAVNDGHQTTAHSLVSGEAYFRQAGAEHGITNSGIGTIAFVEIELLRS